MKRFLSRLLKNQLGHKMAQCGLLIGWVWVQATMSARWDPHQEFLPAPNLQLPWPLTYVCKRKYRISGLLLVNVITLELLNSWNSTSLHAADTQYMCQLHVSLHSTPLVFRAVWLLMFSIFAGEMRPIPINQLCCSTSVN